MLKSVNKRMFVCVCAQVPEAVKLSNAEKLASYEAELSTLMNALSTFENMRA
jgi:hypothetical protein